jgi:hypothetical protein
MSDEARPAVGSEKVVTINTSDGELWARMYAASVAREQELLADRERLIEALERYANKKHWHRNGHGWLNIFHHNINGPAIATEALAKVKEK